MGVILRLLLALPQLGSKALGPISNYMKAHPVLASTFAASGIQGVVNLAMDGDATAIAALTEAANLAGIPAEAGVAATEGLSISSAFNGAKSAISGFFADDEVMSVDDTEIKKIEAYRDLGQFLRSEISANPATVLRHHAMMNEFLKMDRASVERLVGVFL